MTASENASHIELSAQVMAPIAPGSALERIVGLLGSAISQSLPNDDQIIMSNVREAHAMALLLWRANR